MGRTNLIILFFGIFGCVALSLMMGHVVGIKDKKDVHPAVFELEGLFGDDLSRRSLLDFEQRDRREVAVLTIFPRRMEASARLARMIGRHLLRFRGAELKFDALEVVARDSSPDAPRPDQTFPIKVPRGFGSLRRRMLPMPSAPPRRPTNVGKNRMPAAKTPTETPGGSRRGSQPAEPAKPPKPPKRP